MKARIKKAELLWFFGITFALTWGLGALVALFPSQIHAWFGNLSAANPLFIIAVYAPSITALVLTGFVGGFAGLRDLFSSAFRWKVPVKWYLIVLLGVPLLSFFWLIARHSPKKAFRTRISLMRI
jgi:hypothetical protein